MEFSLQYLIYIIGYYSNSMTSGWTPCTSGQYQSSSASVSWINCVAGFFSSPGASACTIWPLNTYSAARASLWTNWATGTFSSSGSVSCSPVWGDSITAAVEPCDDGNTIDGDGWSSACTVEPGYLCKSSVEFGPTTWTTVCGDGKNAGSEVSIFLTIFI